MFGKYLTNEPYINTKDENKNVDHIGIVIANSNYEYVEYYGRERVAEKNPTNFESNREAIKQFLEDGPFNNKKELLDLNNKSKSEVIDELKKVQRKAK